MKKINNNIVKISMVLVVVFASAFTRQTDVFDTIAKSIRENNAKGVASYFNSSVELNIESGEGVYSKTQAEMVLKTFFTNHPCTKFDISHRAKSYGNNSFAIGTYKSASGNFRVTIYVKDMEGKSLIHEMKFEKE